MRTAMLTLLLATTHLAVLGQGKVVFGNLNHRVVIDSSAAQTKGVPWLAGLPAPQIGTPNDVLSSLTAQFWAGTTAQNMTLQATYTPAGRGEGFNDGILWSPAVTLTDVPAGPAFFRIDLWETAAGSYEAASTGAALWYGSTPVFTATAGSFVGNPIYTSAGWPPRPIMLLANPGPAVVPTSLPALISNQIQFSFMAQSNRTYTIEYCNSLTDMKWITLTNVPAQSADSALQIADTMTATERYFRVITP